MTTLPQTPIRKLNFEEAHGCRILSRAGVEFSDGSEERVLEIVSNASDIGSMSDDLELSATNWMEFYHLTKSRANILRPLELSHDMKVLEIGAGCGAITRYLGECCDLVDSLEPVLDRARVARARTRDLSNVEVFVGSIDDIPPDAVYDLVLLVGVLEYVGAGDKEAASSVRFLTKTGDFLNERGHVVCAIENRLGVKYIVGAPDDHSGRSLEGIEGFPLPVPARTFSRTELDQLFHEAGFLTQMLHAFPDYKLGRFVFTDELLETEARSLAWRIPKFPSHDWMGRRPRLADERSVWKSIVEDGTGSRFTNSFVVTASKSRDPALWNANVLGVFYSADRRSSYGTGTWVLKRGEEIRLQRRRLTSVPINRVDALQMNVEDSSYIAGQDFIDVVASSDPKEARGWLGRWRDLVLSQDETLPLSADLVPHNLIVTAEGDLIPVDQEWTHERYRRSDLLERGILWLAPLLAERSPPERWEADRVIDLARELGRWVGLDSGGWIDRAIQKEAMLRAEVMDCAADHPRWEEAVRRRSEELKQQLETLLVETPYGLRESDLLQREHEKRVELELQWQELQSSAAWRLITHIRTIRTLIAPPLSRRDRFLKGLFDARTKTRSRGRDLRSP